MMQRWLLAILILLAPLAGCTGDTKELEKIPEFTVLTEESGTVSNNNFENQAFVIVFSAQWCSNPCHTNLHNLNLSIPGIDVLVVSTDVDEEPNGVTLSMWEQSVNEYDDDEELNQTLQYTFSRVDPSNNFASDMGIDAPGTVIFVDSSGHEIYRKVGMFGAYNDQPTLDIIKGHWEDTLLGAIE
tara:strand:+ start:3908 stop:4462 length:555 start_codon:yes stop_codon:yes gene_type:complete